jgi:hypothetical protein
MFGSVGVPELLIIVGIGAFSLIPILAGIWALVMLIRILSNQQSINARLDALERRIGETARLGADRSG